MKIALKLLGPILFCITQTIASYAYAQDEGEEEGGLEAGELSPEGPAAPSSTPIDYESILAPWQSGATKFRSKLPKRWLYLQEQAGAYGAPSPLSVEKIAFDNYGWFQFAEPDAIRLFVQLNPSQKKDVIPPEDLPARLKRYATIAGADGIVLKTSGDASEWAIYTDMKSLAQPTLKVSKGPDSFRGEYPVQWLVQQLNYDAMVVGTSGEYLVVAKLKPLKRGAQGVILRKSASTDIADSEKDVGALLRIVYDSEDYVLAKVSLSKSGKIKVPAGSKVLFDQP